MTNREFTISNLRKCFDPDELGRFTNCALVFAYNGTGKTRLSYDFAHFNRTEDTPQHTLYYNAYTEDLFTWDNDLENNTERRLMINQDSSLIKGLKGYEFSEKLRNYLHVFTDIEFDFHYDEENEEIPNYVTFSKKVKEKVFLNGQWTEVEVDAENIKISRGEERLFVWCFFRCILDLVIGDNDAYKNIEYIYIDDPMSSLDDNNVIAFGQQLYSVIRDRLKFEKAEALRVGLENVRRVKFVISSHHALFFHVMYHGLNGDNKLGCYYLSRKKENDDLVLKYMRNDAPFYYNVAMMFELRKAIETDNLYTYHFTILRSVMEKIKEFFGHGSFKTILRGIKYKDLELNEDELSDFYSRVMNVLTHQGSMFTPTLMNEDNKELAKTIFEHIQRKYEFNLPNLDDFHSEGSQDNNE